MKQGYIYMITSPSGRIYVGSTKGKKHSEKQIEARRKGCMKPILQYDLEGNFIKEWSGIILASKELNINACTIGSCCKGKNNRAGNYKWKYKINNQKYY